MPGSYSRGLGRFLRDLELSHDVLHLRVVEVGTHQQKVRLRALVKLQALTLTRCEKQLPLSQIRVEVLARVAELDDLPEGPKLPDAFPGAYCASSASTIVRNDAGFPSSSVATAERARPSASPERLAKSKLGFSRTSRSWYLISHSPKRRFHSSQPEGVPLKAGGGSTLDCLARSAP